MSVVNLLLLLVFPLKLHSISEISLSPEMATFLDDLNKFSYYSSVNMDIFLLFLCKHGHFPIIPL